MKIKNCRYPIIQLPSDIQYSLYLIREELKSRKLFHALREAGLDDCYFQPQLDAIIMRSIGLDEDADETFRMYNKILEKRSQKIKADNDSIMKQTFKTYQALMNEKKKLSRK